MLSYLCCPDCRGSLAPTAVEPTDGLFCAACETAFPVRDSIFIILDACSRNPSIELPLVEKMAGAADSDEARAACRATTERLRNRPAASYAWLDEEHWSREYGEQLDAGAQKNWNDRLWQREPLFDLARSALRRSPGPRTVVDFGCGEGQDFRTFLVDHMEDTDRYVALDISLPGLLLNRAHNPHKNALYIIGSADKPPLRDGIADVVICLGVLHHMERKAKGLPSVARLVDRGAILLSDPINGHFLPERFRLHRDDRSAHDDTLDYDALQQELERTNLQVMYERRFSGLVYIMLLAWFRRTLLKRRWVHTAAHRVDAATSWLLGRWIGLFRPRSLLLGLWR